MASDWLIHFRLLFWNDWMEFNETWQEARSQHPLPSLYFSDQSALASYMHWQLSWNFKFDQGQSKNKIASLAVSSKKGLHIVLRCTICGPLGLLFLRHALILFFNSVCLAVQRMGIGTISQKEFLHTESFSRVKVILTHKKTTFASVITLNISDV